MKAIRALILTGVGLSLSACASIDTATRNAPFETLPTLAEAPLTPAPVYAPTATHGGNVVSATLTAQTPVTVPAQGAGVTTAPAVAAQPQVLRQAQPQKMSATNPGLRVNTVTVSVPRKLKVSEANRYYPDGDIVWRGEPIGDRHLQVKHIMEEAMVRGVTPLAGNIPVDLQVEVVRFHALTEKARYTVGGTHSITFNVALRDPATQALLAPVREVRADLDAFGGQQAIEAEARGETQKVRITAHLAEVIRQELTQPDGYKNANLGFFQLVNQL